MHEQGMAESARAPPFSCFGHFHSADLKRLLQQFPVAFAHAALSMDVISALKPGETAPIEYFRGDKRRVAQVKLAERPDQANQG